MTSQVRPSARRGPSRAWSRLKSVPKDDLTVYGFPSKGETRLNDFKAQEQFFARITERYMKFCHESRETLDQQFVLLSTASHTTTPPSHVLPVHSLAGNKRTASSTPQTPNTSQPVAAENKPPPLEPPASTSTAAPMTTDTAALKVTLLTTSPVPSAAAAPTSPHPELILVQTAMRKLREAIVSTHRTDAFALQAYLFLVRTCILFRSWEAYVPALLYLLHSIAPATPLTRSDASDMSAYLILDLACRQGDLHAALEMLVRRRRSPGASKDANARNVTAVLNAVVRDDYGAFWALMRRVDGYQRNIMGFHEEAMRLHALKCLGRSYIFCGKGWVEKCANASWEALKRDLNVGWELTTDGEGEERVQIRSVGKKTTG